MFHLILLWGKCAVLWAAESKNNITSLKMDPLPHVTQDLMVSMLSLDHLQKSPSFWVFKGCTTYASTVPWGISIIFFLMLLPRPCGVKNSHTSLVRLLRQVNKSSSGYLTSIDSWQSLWRYGGSPVPSSETGFCLFMAFKQGCFGAVCQEKGTSCKK